jgi:hypothetical protein
MWQLKAGPVSLHGALTSSQITWLYILFNAACIAAGVALVFFKGYLQTLGISLIVGGLFSFGAFAAQLWSVALQEENKVFDRAYDPACRDPRYSELQYWALKYWDLYQRERTGSGLSPTAGAPEQCPDDPKAQDG